MDRKATTHLVTEKYCELCLKEWDGMGTCREPARVGGSWKVHLKMGDLEKAGKDRCWQQCIEVRSRGQQDLAWECQKGGTGLRHVSMVTSIQTGL